MTPVNARQVKEWTEKDPILSNVRAKVQHGDRNFEDHPQMQRYQKRLDELNMQDGCILWGKIRLLLYKTQMT